MNNSQKEFIELVLKERLRQNELFGVQNNTDEVWLSILVEEVGEVAQAIQNKDFANFNEEIVQIAAVATAWYEARHASDESEASQKR